MNDPERDGGSHYIWRRLGQAQAVEIARLHDAGVTVDALARQYGVCRRTIYRSIARARLGDPVVVEVAGYRAEYVVTPDGPVRVTAWFAA